MIQIKTHYELEQDFSCYLFDSDDNIVGHIASELSLFKVLCDIKEDALKGYYLKHTLEDNSIKTYITSYGTMTPRPEWLVSVYDGLITKLLEF